MKLSMFNVIEKRPQEMFVYNTFSGSLLRLYDEYMGKFEQLEKGKEVNDDKLIENLVKGHILVEDETDEVAFLMVQNNLQRFTNLNISYTIAPTMMCNFRCPYCYEKNTSYATMNQKVVDKMKERFQKDKEIYHYMSVAWYGGEPLLALDIIEELTKEALNIYGENSYYASMVTNGYLLTRDTAVKLKELKIMNIQVTIDGPPDIHNNRRRLESGEDTFYVILNNIKTTLEIYPELVITIRVNIDKENVYRAEEILDYLEEFGLKDDIGLYLAPVDNINGSCNVSQCFDNTEFAIEEMNFLNKSFEKGYDFAYLPQKNLFMCGAVSGNSFVIDPIGDIYKCWNEIGYVDKKSGNIFDSGMINNANYVKWLSYNILKDKECLQCAYLPVCMGGCPHKRIKNGEKKCVPIKENSKDLIELLYKIKRKSTND